MIYGNILGLLFLVIALLVGLGAISISKSEGLGYIVGGGILFALDKWYRSSKGSSLHPFRGGNLFFLPAWLVGVAVFVVGLVSILNAPIVAPARTPVVYAPTTAPTPIPIVSRPTSLSTIPARSTGILNVTVIATAPTPTPCRSGSAFDDIFCGTLVPTPTPRCISWKDAYRYAGRAICVTGVVYAAYLDNPDDHNSPFIVSFDSSASFYLDSYSERFAWKDANLVGKCVEAEGTVRISKGQASIMLESPKQVRMCEK